MAQKKIAVKVAVKVVAVLVLVMAAGTFFMAEKLAIVWGTFIFGIAVAITGSMKLSILLLSLFFFVSFVVISFMKKTKYVK